MPSTYTSNTGIEKPGSGEQAGTWGTTSNNNFDIIDRSLNGVGAITLAGTSHTLTTTDGTLSDGQYKVLVLGGTPSGTNTITISPDDQGKIYLVKNNTAQSVVFTQGSGGNATIPSGSAKIIYANGAGAGAAVEDLSSYFPIAGTVDAATLAISGVPVTSTAAELNVLDGITATTAELNHTDGVTSNIQTQLNEKQSTITGGATTITDSNLTPSRALISDINGKVAASSTITGTELNYLDGVSSNIQTQLNDKQATITGAASTGASSNLTADRAMITDASGKMSVSAVTSTELGYLDGVTSNIQTQFNNVSGYPLDIRVLTSGTSYTIPANAQAILIKASGGGGGGSIHVNPGSGNLGVNAVAVGGDGGTTTVSNSALGISITAPGGPHGTSMASGTDTTNWFTNVGSSAAGGDIFYNEGASGGRTTTNNFDGGREDGGKGVVVQKYVTGAVGGEVLTYALGAGGTAHIGTTLDPEAGRGGYIEIWVW